MGKKRKAFFANNAKRPKKSYEKVTHQLCPSMKGFLITYNSQYTFCLNEAKQILREHAVLKEIEEHPINNEESSQNDFDKLLKAELKELKKEDNQYRIMDAGAKYTIFISLANANVNDTVEAVFNHVESTKRPIGRYVQRFVPVLNTCKAYLENIEPCLDHTFKQVYSETNVIKYSCLFKTSNNGSISRDDVIKLVNNYFRSKNPNNQIDHDNPDFVILIQIIRNMCFISYLKNYFNYRKYNLIEMGAKFVNAEKAQEKSAIETETVTSDQINDKTGQTIQDLPESPAILS